MQCPACQYRFTFCDSFKVLSPYHCSCPKCKTMLTLGKQADRFVIAALVLGAGAAGVGIYLEEASLITSSQAFAASTALLVLGSAIGEWHLWKRGILAVKAPAAN